MKNVLRIFLFFFLCFNISCSFTWANQNTLGAPAIAFEPPTGWRCADPDQLPRSVQVMVVGKGASDYPPSINLGMEPFSGSLEDYLKIVKAINDSQNAEWKSLGTIHTKAGPGNLSQVDMNSSWGSVRLMHVILVKDGQAYILTSAAKRDEFPRFYRQFFKSMRSLHFRKVTEADQPLVAPQRNT